MNYGDAVQNLAPSNCYRSTQNNRFNHLAHRTLCRGGHTFDTRWMILWDTQTHVGLRSFNVIDFFDVKYRFLSGISTLIYLTIYETALLIRHTPLDFTRTLEISADCCSFEILRITELHSFNHQSINTIQVSVRSKPRNRAYFTNNGSTAMRRKINHRLLWRNLNPPVSVLFARSAKLNSASSKEQLSRYCFSTVAGTVWNPFFFAENLYPNISRSCDSPISDRRLVSRSITTTRSRNDVYASKLINVIELIRASNPISGTFLV